MKREEQDREPADDFEFKPLSDGLGFHKKLIDLREESYAGLSLKTGILPKSRPAPPKAPSSPPLISPSQRPSFEAPVAVSARPVATMPWTPALPKKEMVEQPSTVSAKLVQIPVNLAAGAFDSAMVVGLALVFSAIVFALTKIDLNDLIEILQNEGGATIAVFVLLVAVFEIYSVVCRSFFGKTLGEWAFECRLGTFEDQQTLLYPVKVAFRAFLVSATGFIVFPLLSLIFGMDIPGALSGISLFSEKL